MAWTQIYLRLRLDLLDTSGSEQFPAMRRVAILSGKPIRHKSMVWLSICTIVCRSEQFPVMHRVAILSGSTLFVTYLWFSMCKIGFGNVKMWLLCFGWFCVLSGHAFLLVYSLGCAASLEVTSWLQGLKKYLWNWRTKLFPLALYVWCTTNRTKNCEQNLSVCWWKIGHY